jgi:threonine dehydrogenase-like Zn-dependent dehydrogenase
MFFDMLSRGELSLAKLVSHRFPFDQATRAYDLLLERGQSESDPTMAVVLTWQ